MTFGKVIVSLTSAPLTVTATNKSKSAQITFASIVASPPFAIQSDGCSSTPLNARRFVRGQGRVPSDGLRQGEGEEGSHVHRLGAEESPTRRA